MAFPSGFKQSGGTDWSRLTVQTANFNSTLSLNTSTTADAITITGRGIVTDLQFATANAAHYCSIVVDGVEKPLTATVGSTNRPTHAGRVAPNTGQTTIDNVLLHLNGPISFSQSFIVRVKSSASTTNSSTTASVVYHV